MFRAKVMPARSWLAAFMAATVFIAAALPSAPTTAQAISDPSAQPKIRLLVFFATWCVPCRLEIAAAQRFSDAYASAGLVVELISEDGPESAAEIPAFLARYGVTVAWRRDRESALLSRYNPAAGVPFSVLLDRDNRVLFARAGFEPGDERLMREAIVAALKKEPSGQPPSVGSVDAMWQSLGVWRRTAFDPQTDFRARGGATRLQVDGRYANLFAGVRIDGTGLLRDGRDDVYDARLERAYIRSESGWLASRWVVGDFHAAIGEGLALSLRRVDTLGVDLALGGGRWTFGSGDFVVRLTGGEVNIQNLDPIALDLRDDPNDRVVAIDATAKLTDWLSLRPYVMQANAERASATGDDVNWLLGGTALTLQEGSVAWTFDGLIGQRSDADDGAMTAAYSRVVWQVAKQWTVLAEAKAYRRLLIGRPEEGLRYHEPPTLERDDQVVPSNSDAVGGRLRIEHRVTKELIVFANGLYYRYATDGTDPLAGNHAVHGYAGVEKRSGARGGVSLQAGWRREQRPDGELKNGLWHIDLDASWALGRSLTVTAKWNHRSEVAQSFSGERPFVRGLAIAGVAIAQTVVVSGLYGYTSEKTALPLHYPGAELKVYLPNGGEIRAFGGRMAGGRVCVSGTCRDVPAFEGVRLDTVIRF